MRGRGLQGGGVYAISFILFRYHPISLFTFTIFQKKTFNFNLLSLSKQECKSNYSVDNYFKDTLRAGLSKMDKAPKMPRAPKQIAMWVFLTLIR